MVYTLSVWALWMVGAAVIGLVIGWLLGRLGRGRGAAPHDDARFDDRPVRAMRDDWADEAAAPSPSPSRPAETSAEVERLRVKVAELEQLAIERDRLEWELAEARAASHAANPVAAEAVFAPVTATDSSALAAITAERDEWVAKAVAYEQMASELRVRVWNAEARVTELQSALAQQAAPQPVADVAGRAPAAPPRPDLEAGQAALGIPLRYDDLTVIEGVGPQIAQMCVARGIDSWWAMANTDVDRLRRMLAAAGPRFQVHDPSSWPEQARLLAVGDWAGFQRLRHALRGGRSIE